MKNTKIEWATHTFNPWRGCTKVSAGCANCYAEKQAKRNPAVLGIWGDGGTRVVASEKMWKEPETWNAEAFEAEERPRVFCGSMCDIFEDRQELDAHRHRLFDLIERTPNLDWLLLTKRPENVRSLWGGYPIHENVWLGTSVEDQETADKRIPALLAVDVGVRFLSCEPLLGPVGLTTGTTIDWVIVGGESGPGARQMHPDWVRSLRDQCADAQVAFFFKQWGQYWPESQGCDAFWPEEVVRRLQTTLQTPASESRERFWNIGKYAAGRILDGETHSELPEETRNAAGPGKDVTR